MWTLGVQSFKNSHKNVNINAKKEINNITARNIQ